jgi:hypothetical protein
MLCGRWSSDRAPVESVYLSVVTRESVRIMFLVAALNDLSILGADVQNAYINAKTSKKCTPRPGPSLVQMQVGLPSS